VDDGNDWNVAQRTLLRRRAMLPAFGVTSCACSPPLNRLAADRHDWVNLGPDVA
jgi:hypothetical protein